MIGIDEDWRERVRRIMSEGIKRPARDCAAILQDREIVIVGQFTESNNDLNVAQQVEFPLQITATGANFFHRRFIVWRGAVAGRGDVGVFQLQAVVDTSTLRLCRETSRVQHAVQNVAGTVPREHAAGAIRTMRARSQSKNQQPRVRVSKRRNRLSPVSLIFVCSAFDCRDRPAMLDQPRTKGAVRNFALECL